MTFEDKEIEITCMRISLKNTVPFLKESSFSDKNIAEYITNVEDDDKNNTLIWVIRTAIKLEKQKVKDAWSKFRKSDTDLEENYKIFEKELGL